MRKIFGTIITVCLMNTGVMAQGLMETVGAIGIAGAISQGGVAGYSAAMKRNYANNIVDYCAKMSTLAYAINQSANRSDKINGSVSCKEFGNKVGLSTPEALKGAKCVVMMEGDDPTIAIADLDPSLANIVKQLNPRNEYNDGILFVRFGAN